jgi:peptidoglycan/LPS O-acetylase OafA/YrhL
VRVRPRPAAKPLSFRLPGGGFSLQVAGGAPVALFLRRFADPPGGLIGGVAGAAGVAGVTVAIPPDASARPWRLLIAPALPLRLCALDGASAPSGQRQP